IYADLMIGKSEMWQVSCTGCGLSTELDEDKRYVAERWNQRQESARLRMWITTLAVLLPAAVVVSALSGSLLAMSFFR
ncbi:MAG: hypothetical protein ACPG5T_08255, partial [Endozoicomonas sp.]